MQQIPFTVIHHNMAIRGLKTLPDGPGPHPALLMLHGLGGDRSECYGFFALMCDHLAKHGWATVTFNFRYTRDSDGQFSDMLISDEISDAVRMSDWLLDQTDLDPRRLALLGQSIGGFVASCALAAIPPDRFRTVMLTNPTDADNICRIVGEFRPDRRPGEHFHFGTNRLNPRFAQNARAQRPFDGLRAYPGPVLLVQGAKDGAVSSCISDQFADTRRLAGLPVEQVLMPNADHVFNTPALKQELYEKLFAWLTRQVN